MSSHSISAAGRLLSGWLCTLALAAAFYLVFTPAAVVRKLSGRTGRLGLRFDPKLASYRVPAGNTATANRWLYSILAPLSFLAQTQPTREPERPVRVYTMF
jgi:hypothetical protein